MVEIPAFCGSCGAVFGSGIVADNVQGLTLVGNKARCPRCGEWAEIPDGTFDIVENTIRILSAPELTRQRLEELRQVVEAARAGAASNPEESLARLRDQAPELRGVLDFMLSSRGGALAGWLALLVMILTVLAARPDDQISDDQMHEMTRTVIEGVEKAPPPEEITHSEKRPNAQEQPEAKEDRPAHRRSEHRHE